ncbi:hypothetical protein VHEMI02983 [[Torrubiella] hemipterigena]|uniref:Uncharacterized protein n=1 Tax=[Torrubiella] hemipterigena TaxID=1531966 RepID=A0A0A1T9S1_9HYPO|nr:hypothetical protein VHEMI02983 [[Torrubiella] hemipterigena]
MINREKGWGFNIDKHDVWDIVDSGSRRMYEPTFLACQTQLIAYRFFNTISQEYQPDAPPPFYGGIIADPMGLGKTLTMIALVASDLDSNPLPSESEYPTVDMPDTSATLIIVPPPLIPSWEEQLLEHVVPGELSFHRHHGKTRLNDISEIRQFNIVLTTYHTVSAEWKAANGGLEKSPLFSVRWRRIILDEAHFIRNGSSRMARAVCALDSIARWAVTGTPIQNRLGDLASLLKFIQAHPFNDPKRFETDVSRLWKSGSDGEAVNRLKRLSAHILLRRAKATINLPPRRDLVQAVEFTAEERATYKQLKDHTILNIDEALGNDSISSKRHSYVNILQQIESMRLFSNLGFHYLSRHEKPSYQFSENEWSKVAQRTFNSQREMSSLSCKKCLSTVGLSDILLGESTAGGDGAIFTSCLKFFCKECLEKSISKGSSLTCGHTPSCQAAPVSTSSAALEEIDSFVPPTIQNLSNNLSSKVTALIDDIKSLPKDVKCIVFSTWRLTLDLITSGLNAASIQSIRFDGKVAQKDRHTVLKKFRSDPSIQVMLLTLSCGAVGLNLTVASRAYLVEPHWNPTLEEQALARIHRLGQTKEVTTVRFYVKNSFEEEVMQMQESKRQLAGVFLSPHDGGDADSSVSALKRLQETTRPLPIRTLDSTVPVAEAATGTSPDAEAPLNTEAPPDSEALPEPTLSTLQVQLWTEVYDAIKEADPKLIDSYERILSSKLKELELGISTETTGDNSISHNGEERWVQMQAIAKYSLKQTEKASAVADKATQALKVITTVKGVVSSALQSVPQAAVVWTGVLSSSIVEYQGNRSGLKYVLLRMDWYWNLAMLLLKENIVEESSQKVRESMKNAVVKLYEKLLEYQIKSVCVYSRNWLVKFGLNTIKVDDWDGKLKSIKDEEAQVNQFAK